MKKIIALLLAAVLMLNVMSVLAEDNEKITVKYDDALTFAFLLPEGYTMEQETMNGLFSLTLKAEDASKPGVDMLITPLEDDVYGNVERLNDLTEEQLAAFTNDLVAGYNDPDVSYVETELGTKLILVSENGSDMDFAQLLTAYHGYYIFVYISYADNTQVTEDDVKSAVWFLSNLDFIED